MCRYSEDAEGRQTLSAGEFTMVIFHYAFDVMEQEELDKKQNYSAALRSTSSNVNTTPTNKPLKFGTPKQL